MKALLRSLFLFFIFTFPVFGNTLENNISIEKQIESQITSKSSSDKIKKLQTLFKELNLYSGNIDGKYSNIKVSLINYQIKVGLVKNKNDWGAGYFGKKTIRHLLRDYKDKFKKSAEKNLKMLEPPKGSTIFIVTAYYSPIKGQKRYTTGSYWGDVKLNGSGKITASGKKVFPGLLAAPKNYKFGTKIFLEGIGIGSVEDRGGAIVNAGDRGHSSDRIDVWMGYGDEGLDRALKWGKREVKGEILISNNGVDIAFQNSPAYKYRDLLVSSKSSKEDIIKLQTLFKELNLYNGKLDGNYYNIKDSLIGFQLNNKIIKSRYNFQAGLFGPKALAAIRRKYSKKDIFVYNNSNYKVVNNYNLSVNQRSNLEKIKITINKYFDKKLSQDMKVIYLTRLKDKIDILIMNQKDSFKKNQLHYLKEIM